LLKSDDNTKITTKPVSQAVCEVQSAKTKGVGGI
jgi:hypothetical protein